MTRSAEMCMRKTNNSFIIIVVAGAVLVNIRVVFTVIEKCNCISVGTELNSTEGHCCTGIGMTHFLRADKGVYITRYIFVLSYCSKMQKTKEKKNGFVHGQM